MSFGRASCGTKAPVQMAEGSVIAMPDEADGSRDLGEAAWKAQLTTKQFSVLREKATDRAGTGKYDNFYGKGTYACAGCGVKLYTSEMKFDCGCGWPGFWSCVPKTVLAVPDADGRRIEIVCNACNGHLGHVFNGERFRNPVNERHCVNSTSIAFTAAEE
jgi:peptide-methionine (R)-S-oxide reductase